MTTGDRFLIISGLSGAGKTIALHALEDEGFYCVDNLPVGILPTFAGYLRERGLPHFERVAVGVDARSQAASIAELPATLDALSRQGLNPELLFIDATDDTLLKRFSETRRKHPLSRAGTGLSEAIAEEREILDALAARADIRIDTTNSNVHDLRGTIRRLISRRESGHLALQFRSFGFKNGVPRDADFVFDGRCLPNPYWETDLRDLTGLDEPVQAYLEKTAKVTELIDDTVGFLERWLSRFEAVNRSYLTVAFGCTGGRHRSVYVAETVGRHFIEDDKDVVIIHRDL